MNPLVSIVIPTFNSAQWLRTSIESALGQTWPEKEVLVLDDGSTDDTVTVLASFGDRIRWERTENRGVNHARNRLLQMARGEWMQYLDADDYLRPEKIATQLSEAGPLDRCDVIYSPIIEEYWRDGRVSGTRAAPIDPALDLYAQWFAWQLPQTGGCLWRRSLQIDLGGWDETEMCDEHEFYQRAMRRGARFVFAPAPGAVYRIWSRSSRCRSDERAILAARTKLTDALRDWMNEQHTWRESHRRAAGQTCLETARTLARHDLAEAVRYHAEQRAKGLIYLAGPAAPLLYRIFYQLLGFGGAERLARALRRTRNSRHVGP